jgi:hypothetical protein
VAILWKGFHRALSILKSRPVLLSAPLVMPFQHAAVREIMI